jgi:sialate O-acetylesterase
MIRTCVFFFLLLLSSYVEVRAQLKLPRLVSNGMVLQRLEPIKVWGWDTPGQKIKIEFLGKDYTSETSSDGTWTISLPKIDAGGPYEMTIAGSSIVTLQDILVGDVWLCSGQSNMELPLRRVKPLYESEISEVNNQFIRQFEVQDRFNFKHPQEDLEGGSWLPATQEHIMNFGAVAYFFADSLYKKYDVPIGLINAALGGSPAQAWMSEEALQAYPDYLEEKHRFRDDDFIEQIRNEDNERAINWYDRSARQDQGLVNQPTWHSTLLDDSNWETMNVPGYWADGATGEINGIFWFRKTFELSKEESGQPAFLEMGRIVDADSVFLNGLYVGRTTYQYPPRWYQIPEGVLKSGANSIVVRVINNSGRGGFVEDKKYELRLKQRVVDLSGEWRYRLGVEMEPLRSQVFIRWKSGGLFNAMIAPLRNYRFRGVIWYQGESNASRKPFEYRHLFSDLISDWRNHFAQGDFPFLFVQLANFMASTSDPNRSSDWALLRESQLVVLGEPKTAMVVTTDLGEWNDIHPLNKKDVGQRLALAAMKSSYQEEIVHSGPIFKKAQIQRDKILLNFDYVGGGLMAKGGKLKGFAISGKDQQFEWATAKIKKDKVIVYSKKVKSPVAVRYGWADNPDQANLYNKEGLPASPFRTDKWDP